MAEMTVNVKKSFISLRIRLKTRINSRDSRRKIKKYDEMSIFEQELRMVPDSFWYDQCLSFL